MKKIYNLALAISATGILFYAGNAAATTFSFEDTWVDWPGYSSTLSDTNGTPRVDSMNVTVANGFLTNIDIILDPNQTHRQAFDSLFINTSWTSSNSSAWDSWNYFVHDGGTPDRPVANTRTVNGNDVASDGLYEVADDFGYTFVQKQNRIDNPNGIDIGSLDIMDHLFGATQTGNIINYDFSGLTDGGLAIEDGWFVAYAPWCDNDIMGGGVAPVPEPATMLLFGTGLIGLAGYGKKQVLKK